MRIKVRRPRSGAGWQVTAAMLLSLAGAFAADRTQEMSRVLEDFLAKRPTAGYAAPLTMEQARQLQDGFVASLTPHLGQPVGFKAGLVTKEAQARFKTVSPVSGVLFAASVQPPGLVMTTNFGARPVLEADLLVEVKDAGINECTTPLEAAAHLKDVIAYIELPDLFLDVGMNPAPPMLVAINVGARAGVRGSGISVQATPAFVEALEKMVVTLSDDTGAILGEAQGSAILGNPLNAVVWLARDLSENGRRLKAGDLLSLGSFKMAVPAAGRTYTVRYRGLPGGEIEASVRFAK